MRRNRERSLFLAVAAALLLSAPAAWSAGIKCWTNKDGVRECGNAVPPEYAQQGHAELSSRGVTVKETEAAKSEAELEALKKQRELEAQREREARERAQRDRVLLATFTTEEDLIVAREDRLEAIEARIRHTRELLTKLQATRENMLERAAKQERAGEAVSDKLRRELRAVKREIAHHRSFIEARRAEKKRVEEQFAADLARFRELKSR